MNRILKAFVLIVGVSLAAMGLQHYSGALKFALWNFRIQYLLVDCKYAAPHCADNEFCAQFHAQQGKCFAKSTLRPEVIFPRNLESPTVCSQGNLTREGRTHSYLNTAYAVDLSTPPSHANAYIRAVFNGYVVAHEGCDNRDSESFNNDSCGQGFGNWIALFDRKSSLIAFYAHLRKLNVKTGDAVAVGQLIGEEGKTGSAGHRHLHFSVHENTFGITPRDMGSLGAWLPPSIPFMTKITDSSGNAVLKSVEELPCQDSDDLSRAPFFGG